MSAASRPRHRRRRSAPRTRPRRHAARARRACHPGSHARPNGFLRIERGGSGTMRCVWGAAGLRVLRLANPLVRVVLESRAHRSRAGDCSCSPIAGAAPGASSAFPSATPRPTRGACRGGGRAGPQAVVARVRGAETRRRSRSAARASTVSAWSPRGTSVTRRSRALRRLLPKKRAAHRGAAAVVFERETDNPERAALRRPRALVPPAHLARRTTPSSRRGTSA